ncbi:hypothetical protein JYK21_29560 [Ralstonia pickettii]|nr:hypothetical protein [Ralstonia pickettii]
MNIQNIINGRKRCGEKNKQKVVDALIAAGKKGCTTSQLLERANLSRATCLNQLHALRDAGQAHVGRLLQLKNRTVDVWVYGPSRTEEEPPVEMPDEANGEQDDWRGDWTARRDAAASWF